MANQFDKFTSPALKVLSLAQDEGQRFNHNYIGTEHLLLGLLHEGEGVAARVLTNMGVQLPKVRSAVEFIIGRGDAAVIGEIGLTPRAKKVIELAIDEARRLNHDYIGTEHLLLGVVREGQGIAAGVLESLGVNLEKIRHQVLVHLESARQGDQPVRIRRLDQRDLSRKFSARSRRVLVFARDEALSMQHGAIDSGHFLIGFLREGEGIAARVLIDSGVEIQRLRALLSTRIVQRPGPKKDFDLTDRSAAELTMSMRLADQQQCTRVGTGHMLLAICTVELEAPTNFLADLGFDPDRLRHEVSMLLED